MNQPVSDIVWPLAATMQWFDGKSTKDVTSSEDKQFKNQLKQNALKIVYKTNRSFQDKIDAWYYLKPQRQLFESFFKAIIRLALSEPHEFELTHSDRYQLLTFFNYAFNSIEVDFVHAQIKKYLPLSIWINLSKSKRSQELSKLSQRVRIAWDKLEQQDKTMDAGRLRERMFERKFIYYYIKQFLGILEATLPPRSADGGDEKSEATEFGPDKDSVLYCQRFIEFIIDIESQLPLRRFFHALLEDTHFIVRCQLSSLARHKSSYGQLFNQLVELLKLYSRYEIDLMTGNPLSDTEVLRRHEQRILSFQKILWSQYEHLKEYATKPIKAIDNPAALYKIVTGFDSKEDLYNLLRTVGLADDETMSETDRDNASLMASILMDHYRRYESQMSKINSIPLFPNESVIWDTNLVPDQYYNYEYPLALPKLNLQFLTMSDYLLRNFMLFKNESTYEIRQDIEDGIFRSKCRWTAEGNFATGPKQRMSLVIKDFAIIDVAEPKLGEQCPSRVRAKVVLNMDFVRPEWKTEWEQLRKHDTCFLISFRKPSESDKLGWPEGTFPAKHHVKYVRGCEIEGLVDSEGRLVDENLESPKFTNNIRTFHVLMDCNQYQIDQNSLIERKTIVYDKFHLMVRRKPEKNNFKGVLETIRNIINTKFVVPEWLRDLLIGFGDPNGASPNSLRNKNKPLEVDYFDTFLSYEHLKSSFEFLKAGFKISADDTQDLSPPFKVRIDETNKEIFVTPYKMKPRSPYPITVSKKNSLQFTPAQVDAISNGLQEGLTMVVGPPGTGKTDVAVQILSTLYHSNPNQRTLIVTHSNQALNQIFSKMIELDVQEHHLLRMGHGEEDLNTDQDFSRQGRIKHVLKRRLELLVQADRLARSMGLSQGEGLTCQSSEYFYSYHIEPRWRQYKDQAKNNQLSLEDIGEQFPFKKFFDDAPQPLFKKLCQQEDLEIAKICFRYVKDIFKQLSCFRPFEIFQNASDRSKYLLIREAKIIAMTCTHAGLRRKELVEMNFQYDNILMEETAQILEIETTIPLLLQNPENGVNRLKRWIMIGDHNQLPPIIQNSAFQKFSNMEQSLFARFVRLGVPHIQLDAQGRARPSLCDLYRWRYKDLRDLALISSRSEFARDNVGFKFEYQLINVDDYEGVGESTPMPHYYQNRGEAEFLVAVYRYMTLTGYMGDKITILTTYNGQKQLLRDLIEHECAKDEYLPKPSKITTVDKFQGQQNDYILLSLVRTKSVGHLRDIRRLVVAMSRARLGLYIFARVNLFRTSVEIQPAMNLLLERPTDLHLMVRKKGIHYNLNRWAHINDPDDFYLDNPPKPSEIREVTKVIKSVEEMRKFASELNHAFRADIAFSDRMLDQTHQPRDQ